MKSYETLQWRQLKLLLPKRLRDTSKGDYGHVLIIGGDYGMSGAVRMAGEAALRTGAGLVSVATRPEHLAVVSGPRPEIMCHCIVTPDDLAPLLTRATVLVLGPGLGKSAWSRAIFDYILTECMLPMVLDADGLNLLAETPQQYAQWILTPHSAEASRLLNCSIASVQQDRQAAVRTLQAQFDGVAILKGPGTLICQKSSPVQYCAAGNPGMASGGMGDVLSGVIGGLLAQQLNLFDAAQTGVLIHSMAADQAAAASGERGLLASDLFPYLRTLVNEG
jgi:ADP-dependent NAD(P)H-hydrate dehydratase / NAD(P)H-hydrate epimerase